MQEVAERERKARDLRAQVAELDSNLEGEVVFQHIRTRRNPVTIYSILDGEPISIPEYMVASAIIKTLPDGRFMFTDNPAEAPEYKRGTVKCFLHAESAERGLEGKVCPAGALASAHAKRMHGQHRHHQEYEAYTEYLSEQRDADQWEQQRQQLDATLAIARSRSDSQATAASEAICGIGGCEFMGTAKQVRGHKMGAHK